MRLRAYTLLLLMFGACGECGSSDVPARVDATAVDVGPGSDAAAAGLVEVTVYYYGALFPGASVLFLDATDAVVLQGITNAQGVASAIMLPGGSVTAVLLADSGFAGQQVFTYLDVKPGDHLVVGTPGQPRNLSTILRHRHALV